MLYEYIVNEWTVRVFASVNNWWKAIAVRGEGSARQVRVYDKLTHEQACALEPEWSR